MQGVDVETGDAFIDFDRIGLRHVVEDKLNALTIEEPPELEDVPGPIEALDNFFIGINTLKKDHNGEDLDQQMQQLATINVYKLLELIADIEDRNLSTAKICCKHGFHRSVGLAEMLRKHFYKQSPEVTHLDIHHPRNVHGHKVPKPWPCSMLTKQNRGK